MSPNLKNDLEETNIYQVEESFVACQMSVNSNSGGRMTSQTKVLHPTGMVLLLAKEKINNDIAENVRCKDPKD